MGMLDDIRNHRTVERLLKDREAKVRYGDFPADIVPPNIVAAYGIQDSMIRRYEAKGVKRAGWKVALSSEAMQQAQGVRHPVAGPVLAPLVQSEPGTVSVGNFLHLCAEAEIAFRITEPLDAKEGPWDADSVTHAVGAAMAAIEIADDRYARDASFKSITLLTADFAHNFGCVLGAEVAEWQDIDLAAEALSITLNDHEIGVGTGAAVLDHPLKSLAWLANNLNARRLRLEPGDFVLTGCVTETIWMGAGEKLVVEATNLGRVTLSVTD